MDAEPYSAAAPQRPQEALKLAPILTARRLRYLRSGYTPLPCIGKVPTLPNWADVRITAALIKGWGIAYRSAFNTGLRTTYNPAIDLDIYDANVVELVEAALLKLFPPDRTILRRVGQAPKRLIPCCCLVPFRKAAAVFRAPDDTIHRVEVLGQGQQFIAEGWHPTGAPYTWLGRKLIDTLPTELPRLDAATVNAFLINVRQILAAQGWVEVKDSSDGGGTDIRRPQASRGNGTDHEEASDSAYARAALERECEAVASAAKGTRNNTLNRAAFNLFQLVAGGELDADNVTTRLTAAATECGLVDDDGEESVASTIASGAKAGRRGPRRAPTLDDDATIEPIEQVQPTRHLQDEGAAPGEIRQEERDANRRAEGRPQRPQGEQPQGEQPTASARANGGAGATGGGASRSTGGARHVDLVRAHAVVQRPIEWLWKPRLALGKIALIAGDPGVGKSSLIADIVARSSAARMWPDAGFAPCGNCIILSAEDAADDTICPRLEIAGANMSRVFLMRMAGKPGTKLTFSLGQDLPLLATAIEQLGNVILLAIDPITAYLGDKIDTHQTAAVRAVLEPLDTFAAYHRCAIFGVTHPPKAVQSKAINAFTGSLAFVAASRTAFVAIEEPETDRRLLLAVKSNIGPPAPGIAYRLVPAQTDKGIEAIRVEWDGEPVDITANEAMNAAAEAAKNSGQKQEAERFLETMLADGPVAADRIIAAAEANGISKRTLDRAKKSLRVVSEKDEFRGSWAWRLPR
jgi:putative DNA primase/helicase